MVNSTNPFHTIQPSISSPIKVLQIWERGGKNIPPTAMGRLLPLFLIVMTSMAAMAWAAATWVVIPNVDKDSHVQSLGAYAVAKQNNPYLKFIKVVRAEVLDRGTQHYTYRLAIQLVEGSQKKYYWSEVLQDLGAPNQPPVLNIASFKPISGPASTPNWVTIPDVQKNLHVRSIITYAVEKFNSQTQASFEFIDVLDGQLLDRGAKHYTYHLTIRVHDRYGVKKYKIEVFEDLNTPGEPPVLNLGYFILV